MAIDIQEKMQVHAPPERVWTYMLDAENVIQHLPGAKMLEVADERHFTVQMKVRVGTVSVTYKGDVELTEVDEENRRVEIAGKWREQGGAGNATMSIKGKVAALDDGGSEVIFDGSADVVGRIVQFGRGMIQSVSKELFKQFSAGVRADLEALTADEGEQGAGGEQAAGGATGGEPEPGDVPAPQPAAEDEGELDALPLLFKALWSSIKRFFARLFGRAG